MSAFKIEAQGIEWFQIRDNQPFPVDVFLFWNDYMTLLEETGNDKAAITRDVIDLVIRSGAPADTSGMEAAAVINRVAELLPKKKDSTEEPPSSPES